MSERYPTDCPTCGGVLINPAEMLGHLEPQSRTLGPKAREILATLEPLVDCGWLALWQRDAVRKAVELVRELDESRQAHADAHLARFDRLCSTCGKPRGIAACQCQAYVRGGMGYDHGEGGGDGGP